MIRIRKGRPSDEPFIYNTWLRSYYANSGFARSIRKAIYYLYHKRIVAAILATGQILVAVDEQKPDVIYGYAVYQDLNPPLIHYVYVKKAFRKCGVARAMFGTIKDFMFTHLTKDAQAYLEAHNECVYVPYLLPGLL